jgi:hypothetical protein
MTGSKHKSYWKKGNFENAVEKLKREGSLKKGFLYYNNFYIGYP